MLNRTITIYKESFSGLSKDIWLLSFVMFINRSGSMVMPFLSLYFTGVLDEGGLEMSYFNAGVLMTLFGIGTVGGQWLGGKLTDTIGYYPVQFWTLLVSGFIYISLIFVQSFELWCVAMVVTGVITDAFRPANMASIDIYSKPENRTRSLTLVRLAVNLGFSVGPAVAGIIAATLGFNWLFIIDGLTCISAAILFRILLENKGIIVKNGSESKKDIAETNEPITDDIEALKVAKIEASEEKPSMQFGKFDSPYKDKYFLIFVGLNLFMAISFLQFVFTLPVYFEQNLEMSKQTIGFLLAMNGFIIFIIEMPIIYILEQKGHALKLLTIGLFFFVLAFGFLTFSTWFPLIIIVILLLTIAEIISFPFATTFAMSRAKAENRGSYMGTFGLSWSVGRVIAPLLGMQLAEVFGFSTMWSIMTGFCAIAMFGMWWLKNKLLVDEDKWHKN